MSCHSLMPPLSPKYPWLVAQNFDVEGDDTQTQVFYNLHDPLSHYPCQIPELLGKRIRGCFHGCWVLLSSDRPRDVTWSLWNPVTSKVIDLPPLNLNGSLGDIDYIGTCCLSAPPEHLNSVLLLTISGKPNFVHHRLGRRKDLRWTESTYAKQVRIITGSDCLLHSLTCCNGTVYGCISDSVHSRLFIVEVKFFVNDRKRKKLGEVVITLLPFMEFACPNKLIGRLGYSMEMQGSCTDLFIVLILKDKRNTVAAVNIFKLDQNNMTWEETEDLKDTMLYVNLSTSCFVSNAIVSSELGGYIHIVLDNGRIIYSYHVKEKTISLSSMPNLSGTSHISLWAMPRLESDCFHLDYKQEKDGEREDEIVGTTVEGNHEVGSHLLRLESDNADSKQENDKDVDIILRSVKGDEDESLLLNLPLHVLEMVMKFSEGVEYLKFRSTCKTCHLAAPLIQWNNGKASKRLQLQEYSLLSPWMMVFDKHEGIITFTDPLFGDKYFIKTPQELICDFHIKCSRYGWLLILKLDTSSLVLFNPFTSDIRELPQLSNNLDICSFSAPATSDCMVVAITMGPQYYQVCIHFLLGNPSWLKLTLDVKDGEMFDSFMFYRRDLYALREDKGLDIFEDLCELIAHDDTHDIREIGREGGGDLYRLRWGGGIHSYKLRSHAWVRNVVQAPTSCATYFPESFQMMRREKYLFRVIMGRFGESLEVFELNCAKTWLRVNALRGDTIFICGTSSFCAKAKTPEMENKIFFLRDPIVYYSFKTRRFHTFDNTNIQDSFGDLSGIKQHLAPHCWIEPSWI